MFDKNAINRLDDLKSQIPIEEPKVAPQFDAVIPLVDEEFSRNKARIIEKGGVTLKRLVKELFLKTGNPTVEQAIKRMRSEIPEARALGFKIVRIIHGYGSTGTGGALKTAILEPLQWMINEGVIESFIPGEKFNCFCDETLNLVNEYPALKKDHDYRYENPGMTIIVL